MAYYISFIFAITILIMLFFSVKQHTLRVKEQYVAVDMDFRGEVINGQIFATRAMAARMKNFDLNGQLIIIGDKENGVSSTCANPEPKQKEVQLYTCDKDEGELVVTNPLSTTTKPASTTTKPASMTTKPASTTTKPASMTTKPASTTTTPATNPASSNSTSPMSVPTPTLSLPCGEARLKYLDDNNDVKKQGIDPWRHYQNSGRAEGRVWPGQSCDSMQFTEAMKQYIVDYPDLSTSVLDPWTDYMTKTVQGNQRRLWKGVSAPETQTPSSSEKKIFIKNDKIIVGFDLEKGATITYIAVNNDKKINLINAYDTGRCIQQSYYGDIDGSVWPFPNDPRPWRYNPIQGGDYLNQPALVKNSSKISDTCYTAMTIPRHFCYGCTTKRNANVPIDLCKR